MRHGSIEGKQEPQQLSLLGEADSESNPAKFLDFPFKTTEREAKLLSCKFDMKQFDFLGPPMTSYDFLGPP